MRVWSCRLRYKAYGPGAKLSFEVPPGRRAELDGMTLEQLVDSYRRAVRARKSSQYRGVTWNRKTHKWQAQIRVEGRLLYIGSYVDERQAALLYDDVASRLHGA
jgi:hypothetical protein